MLQLTAAFSHKRTSTVDYSAIDQFDVAQKMARTFALFFAHGPTVGCSIFIDLVDLRLRN